MVEETKEGGDFMSSLKNGYEMTCVQVEEIGNNCQVQMGNIADCDATVLTNMIPSCDGSFLPDCSDTCETVQGYCTLPSKCEIPNCDGMTDACTTPEYCQDVSKNICCGCDGCDDDTCNFCKKSECLEGVCPDICPKDCCETPACIQDACDAVNVACNAVSTGVGDACTTCNNALAPPECVTTNPACRPRILPKNIFDMQLCGGSKDACYDPLELDDVPTTWCPVAVPPKNLPDVIFDTEHHVHELTKKPWMKYHYCDVCRQGDIGQEFLYRCEACDFDAHLTCVNLPEGVSLPNDVGSVKPKRLKEGVCPAPTFSLGMEFYNPDTGHALTKVGANKRTRFYCGKEKPNTAMLLLTCETCYSPVEQRELGAWGDWTCDYEHHKGKNRFSSNEAPYTCHNDCNWGICQTCVLHHIQDMKDKAVAAAGCMGTIKDNTEEYMKVLEEDVAKCSPYGARGQCMDCAKFNFDYGTCRQIRPPSREVTTPVPTHCDVTLGLCTAVASCAGCNLSEDKCSCPIPWCGVPDPTPLCCECEPKAAMTWRVWPPAEGSTDEKEQFDAGYDRGWICSVCYKRRGNGRYVCLECTSDCCKFCLPEWEDNGFKYKDAMATCDVTLGACGAMAYVCTGCGAENATENDCCLDCGCFPRFGKFGQTPHHKHDLVLSKLVDVDRPDTYICDICGDQPVLYSCAKPGNDGEDGCDFDICESCYVDSLQDPEGQLTCGDAIWKKGCIPPNLCQQSICGGTKIQCYDPVFFEDEQEDFLNRFQDDNETTCCPAIGMCADPNEAHHSLMEVKGHEDCQWRKLYIEVPKSTEMKDGEDLPFAYYVGWVLQKPDDDKFQTDAVNGCFKVYATRSDNQIKNPPMIEEQCELSRVLDEDCNPDKPNPGKVPETKLKFRFGNQEDAKKFFADSEKNPRLEVNESWFKIKSKYPVKDSTEKGEITQREKGEITQQRFFAKVTKFELKKKNGEKFEATYSVMFNENTSEYADDDTRKEGKKANVGFEDFLLSSDTDTVVNCYSSFSEVKAHASVDKKNNIQKNQNLNGYYYREQTVFVKIEEAALSTVPNSAFEYMYTKEKSKATGVSGKNDKSDGTKDERPMYYKAQVHKINSKVINSRRVKREVLVGLYFEENNKKSFKLIEKVEDLSRITVINPAEVVGPRNHVRFKANDSIKVKQLLPTVTHAVFQVADKELFIEQDISKKDFSLSRDARKPDAEIDDNDFKDLYTDVGIVSKTAPFLTLFTPVAKNESGPGGALDLDDEKQYWVSQNGCKQVAVRLKFYVDGANPKYTKPVKIPVHPSSKGFGKPPTYNLVFTDYFDFSPWKCPENNDNVGDNRSVISSATQKSATSAKLNEAKNAGYCPRVLSQANEMKIAKKIQHHSAGVEKVMNFVAKVSHFRFNPAGNAGKKDKDDKPLKCRLQLTPSYNNKDLLEKDVRFLGPDKDDKNKNATAKPALMQFIQPDTEEREGAKWFTNNQRLTYSDAAISYQQPATLLDIQFGDKKDDVSFKIKLDIGRQILDDGVEFSDITIRPDLVNEEWNENIIFGKIAKNNQTNEEGETKTLTRKEFEIDRLEITELEHEQLITKKSEHWVSLPESIYGSAICYLIVSRELNTELVARIGELKEKKDHENDHSPTWELLKNRIEFFEHQKDKDMPALHRQRCPIILFQLFLTFMIQGILIYWVWAETPSANDYYQTDWDNRINGLCSVNSALQLAAIGTLCLWTMTSGVDIWTEWRCYIAKAYVRDNAGTDMYTLRRIARRTYLDHVIFCIIVGLEVVISVTVFIAGINFILSQTDAADIVQGVLGISFIVEIDDKVYQTSFIDEEDPGNVEICLFRTTEWDVGETIVDSTGCKSKDDQDTGSTKVTFLSLKKDKTQEEDSMGNMVDLGPAAFVNLLQWPLLIAIVCGIVFGMRTTYCGDYVEPSS